jgi:hypothetical protein
MDLSVLVILLAFWGKGSTSTVCSFESMGQIIGGWFPSLFATGRRHVLAMAGLPHTSSAQNGDLRNFACSLGVPSIPAHRMNIGTWT